MGRIEEIANFDNFSNYGDEYLSITRKEKKLIINFKKIPDFYEIIKRSGIFWYTKQYYADLTTEEALSIEEKNWEKLFKISKPFVFERIAEKTTKKYELNNQNAVYMILLQNFIQSQAFGLKMDKTIIYPEFYNNTKRRRADPESIFICNVNGQKKAVKYLNNGDPIIPQDLPKFDYVDFNTQRRGKTDISKSLIPYFLWFEEQLFGVHHSKINIQFMFWTENLKYALENGFSFWIYTLSAENFQNLVMKTFRSWSKQLNIKTFKKLKKLGIISIEIYNKSTNG